MSKRSRKRAGRQAARRPDAGGPSWPIRLARFLAGPAAMGVLVLLFLTVPLVFSQATHESFRLPKQLLAGVLALASLVLLSFRLLEVTPRPGLWSGLVRHPAVLAAVPLLLVALPGLVLSDHPLQVKRGLTSLLIGTACLVGWSLALSGDQKRRLLRWHAVPALLLLTLLVLQFFKVFNPFEFQVFTGRRMTLTSLAGNTFDLSAYLTLVALVAQAAAWEAVGRRRLAWAAVAVTCLFGVVVTMTVTSLVTVAVASLVLWWGLLPRPLFARLAGAGAAAGLAAVALLGPVRNRLAAVWLHLSGAGDLNQLLTGRLDGWRTALRMWHDHPVWGVGQGAFSAEFSAAKQVLTSEGVPFFPNHVLGRSHFTMAHNEFLEVAAECGTAGVLALLWGLAVLGFCLVRRVRAAKESEGDDTRARRADAALMVSFFTALLLLALTNYPFHVAMVAYPSLLLLSWLLEERP